MRILRFQLADAALRLTVALTFCATLSMAQNTKNFPTTGRIVREDPRLDQLIAPDAKIEVLAGGFEWAEGPVWYPPAGGLLFSDVPNNVVILWKEGVGTSVFMKPSGYTGVGQYSREPGSNGLTVDTQGRLAFAEHGDRRVSVLTKDGGKRTLADNFEGKRFNSPNDLVFDSQNNLYFTDPPYGLPKQQNDTTKELDFFGVFRLSKDGKLTAVVKDLVRPNGVALSPDEKTMYVAQSDRRAVIMAYPINADGTVGAGKVFADNSPNMGKMRGSPDGLKVDVQGNVFASGPGGIHVWAPDGKLLGRIETGEASANVAWGDDGSTLYITADMWLCRVKTKTKGAGLHWMAAGVK